MWDAVTDGMQRALGVGTEPSSLNSLQTSLRAMVVFVYGVAIVRVGNKRFLGKSTPLDVLLAVMLGAVLGRAINGSGPLLPTLVASTVMVLLHRLLAAAAFHSHALGTLLKGHARKLIEHGQLDDRAAAKTHLSRHDLEEAVRIEASGARLEDVESAYLERSGDISVRKKQEPPRIVEVRVEEGVQWVRIELKS